MYYSLIFIVSAIYDGKVFLMQSSENPISAGGFFYCVDTTTCSYYYLLTVVVNFRCDSSWRSLKLTALCTTKCLGWADRDFMVHSCSPHESICE